MYRADIHQVGKATIVEIASIEVKGPWGNTIVAAKRRKNEIKDTALMRRAMRRRRRARKTADDGADANMSANY
jgi:hypothetical protein